MPKKLKNLKITKVDFVDEGANPDANIVLVKRRASGAAEPETDAGDVEKSAATFSEALGIRNLDKITDDMWNLCYALNCSLCSILTDEKLDATQKQAAMLESVEEFVSTTKEAIPSWADGKEVGLVAKATEGAEPDPLTDRIAETLAKGLKRAFAGMPNHTRSGETETTEPKGEETDMRIDKSKLTQREAAFLEAIEKKAGIPNEAPTGGDTAPSGEGGQESAPVEKAAPAAPVAASEPVPAPVPDNNGGEDVFKSLPPEVRQEFEALRKFRQDTEDAKLREIAGSYTIIGKSADQLFPVLKSLKATSPEAYDAMISTLNDAKASVEKSGVFNEIGRTGNGTMERGGAVKEAEAKAAELMKSRKGMTRQQAIDQVLQEDPELAKRYEEEE